MMHVLLINYWYSETLFYISMFWIASQIKICIRICAIYTTSIILITIMIIDHLSIVKIHQGRSRVEVKKKILDLFSSFVYQRGIQSKYNTSMCVILSKSLKNMWSFHQIPHSAVNTHEPEYPLCNTCTRPRWCMRESTPVRLSVSSQSLIPLSPLSMW